MFVKVSQSSFFFLFRHWLPSNIKLVQAGAMLNECRTKWLAVVQLVPQANRQMSRYHPSNEGKKN